MNILFTCACGQKSEKLFYILKKNFKKKINIIGCDIKKKIGKSYLDHFEKIKFTSNRIFLNQILRLCEKYKINFLFASADRELEILSKNKNKFKKIKTIVLINEMNYTKIFNDKFKTYEFLKKINIELPKYKLIKKYSSIEKDLKEFGYPKRSVIVKSRYGIGGRGVHLLLGDKKIDIKKYKWFGNNGREKKIFFLTKNIKKKIFHPNKSIIMEALVSPSYDVDVLKINKNYMTSIRKRLNPSGIPYKGSKIVKNKKIEMIIKKILKKFDLKFILDFDFMTHDKTKRPIICEINTRPSGSIVDSEIQGKKIFTKFLKILLKS